MADLGIVIIGRNEGERLRVCLSSLVGQGFPVVYVDSGSTDGSVDAARQSGAHTVCLSRPFSAAKARNAGLAQLMEVAGEIEYVQFVDGDVEIAPGWLDAAIGAFKADPRAAVICGRLRERFPERSIYNRLCDIEWDRPAGETESCGGIAMMRAGAVRSGGGFREDLIAGEEPELCLRLQRGGWKIVRLSEDMGWHDAAMERFGQWWRRTVRAGHGYAQSAWLHGSGRERYCVREVASICLWAGAVPLAALAGAWASGGWSLVLLGAYPVQWWRIALKERRRERRWGEAASCAMFTMLGKFAQLEGVLRFMANTVRGRSSKLIEYKGARLEPVETGGGN